MVTPAFRSILVPLDGSASADAALRLALRLVAPDGEVVVAHAINRAAVIAECVTPYGGDPEPALKALEADERDILGRAQEEARKAGVRCSAVALDGVAAAGICSAARQRNVDALAMGTHGRRGLARIVLGSTAAAVLHGIELPTFVVHEESARGAAAPFREILVAFDGSAAAENAVHAAVGLAVHDGGRVMLVHVAETRDGALSEAALDDARSDAVKAGIASDAAIVHGDPVDAIVVSAEACHADLIAIGSHARGSGLFGLGSVTEAVVRTSPVPVLVMPAIVKSAGVTRTTATNAAFAL